MTGRDFGSQILAASIRFVENDVVTMCTPIDVRNRSTLSRGWAGLLKALQAASPSW
jgi:hypothetical protein